MKRILSVLLACCLLFFGLPITTYAGETGNEPVGSGDVVGVDEAGSGEASSPVGGDAESGAAEGNPTEEGRGVAIDGAAGGETEAEGIEAVGGTEGGSDLEGEAGGTGSDAGDSGIASREDAAEPEGTDTDMSTEQPNADMADGDGTAVSRVQWLHELTALFGMDVEEEGYPDNYYSDVDTSSAYYHDVMVATEFGLADVEAGDAFCPEEPATREFAAHTLNLCLGFAIEDRTYVFTDAADTAYAGDVQVALDRGWFTLSDGHALPKAALTIAEKEAMLSDAASVLETVKFDSSHNDQYEFAEGVIVLPEGTAAEQGGSVQGLQQAFDHKDSGRRNKCW